MTAVPKWALARADALEAQADYVQHAVMALENLDGLFVDRREIADHVENARTLLTVELENLLRSVKRLRDGASAPAGVA